MGHNREKKLFPPWGHFWPCKVSSLTDILQNNGSTCLFLAVKNEDGRKTSEGHIGGSHRLLCFLTNAKVRKKKNTAATYNYKQ